MFEEEKIDTSSLLRLAYYARVDACASSNEPLIEWVGRNTHGIAE